MTSNEFHEEHSNKLRILSIGSNAISAFYSWRLQASQAADVTIVWRSHYEAVAQYGISFRHIKTAKSSSIASVHFVACKADISRSDVYGPDRFRPSRVVRNVDEAAGSSAGYDYVLVCIKALPDIYKLGEVIKPVITPSHTCIIVNTTTAIDVETELMELFPRNMVLSLCSGVDVTQTGPADFDHTATHSVHIGALRENSALPREAQEDMKESLTLTLEAGALECTTTNNIEKYQWERLIGPIAFHPISVILKEPNHAKLMDDQSTKDLIHDIFNECIKICEARKITFPYDFESRVVKAMTTTKEAKSTMYQDFLAGRPLEIEVYLTTPIRFARQANLDAPHMRSIHALLNHINKINQQKPASPLPQAANRLAPQHTGQSTLAQSRPYIHRGVTDGAMLQNGGRSMSMVYGAPPPPTKNGYARSAQQQQQQNRRLPSQISRQDSLEGLEGLAAVAMYNDLMPSDEAYPTTARSHVNVQGASNEYPNRSQNRPPSRASTSQGYYAPPEKNGQRPIRQGAFAMMGRKMSNMRSSGRDKGGEFEDDDDDNYVDEPIVSRGPAIDPEKVDMLAMTRRGRNSALGNRLEADRASSFASGRPKPRQSKSSSDALMNDIPGVHDSVTNSALFGMGDNRYGTVDSRTLAKSANDNRLNSMQSTRAPSMTYGYNAYPGQQIRPPGPPNAMNGRGPYTSDMPYRNRVVSGNPNTQFRGQIPPQTVQRQQILAQAHDHQVKGINGATPAGARSVTGSASASFGSLGNGSGSHSSSSSRDEMPQPLPVAR